MNKKLEEQPLVILGGLIFMVVLSLVMISNNPTSDKYISTVIAATPDPLYGTAIPRNNAGGGADGTLESVIAETCRTNLALSSLEFGQCRKLVIEKRQYLEEFLDNRLRRSNYIILSYFDFELRETGFRRGDSGGKAMGIFNRLTFDSSSDGSCLGIGLAYLGMFGYLGWNAIKLFVLKRRNS